MPLATLTITYADGNVLAASDLNTNFTTLNTATVPVANGGTGLTAGTSGGFLYFSAATTIASSGALTANAIVLGGGAGATPTTLAGTSGGVVYFSAANTAASSGALTASAIVLGGGAGATPTSLALGTANRVLGMNSGATAHEYKTIAAGTGITVNHTANQIEIVGSASVSAATQAEMEAASSTTTYASPGRVQYHPGVAKVWGNWNDAGTLAASYNISSITDTGVGNHTVNFTTGFSGNTVWTGLGSGHETAHAMPRTPAATGSQNILGRDNAGAANDLVTWQYAAFGDQ